jgi:ceramide glucosyltransferase
LARPCFGSTLALRRQTLGEIGGFIAFADCLADDYAMGAALRARGHTISIPPFAIAHMCTEASARDFWRHELRWARTIKSIDPIGYAGSIVAHPLAWALIAALLGRRLDRFPAGDRHRPGVDRMPDGAFAAGAEGICPASAGVLACARA